MYVDRIVYPVKSLGPKDRIVIWVSGCARKCPNCANPELWEQKDYQKISIDELMGAIKQICQKNQVGGITISGGEPFQQARELRELIDHIKKGIPDILVYTGFSEREILEDPMKSVVLTNVTALVDGEYIHDLNDGKAVLKGSTNQNVLIYEDEYKEIYRAYLSEGRKVQNMVYDNTVISIGIHNR